MELSQSSSYGDHVSSPKQTAQAWTAPTVEGSGGNESRVRDLMVEKLSVRYALYCTCLFSQWVRGQPPEEHRVSRSL